MNFITDEMIKNARNMPQVEMSSIDYSVCNLPRKYYGVTFDVHPNEWTECLRDFSESKKGVLILQGGNGTGKTESVCAMFTNRIQKGLVAGLYLSNKYELCPLIRTSRSFSANINEYDLLKRYYTTPFLAIDEVGKGDNEVIEKMFVSNVLSARYDNELPTVLVTNWTTKELEDFLGDEIKSRFLETATICTLNERDFREKVETEVDDFNVYGDYGD